MFSIYFVENCFNFSTCIKCSILKLVNFRLNSIMVKVNLSKFLQLVVAIKACPEGVPHRNQKLNDSFASFQASCDEIISIHLSPGLERLNETNIDDEDTERKKNIINEIIKLYTNSTLIFPQSGRIFLISSLEKCNVCESGNLVAVRPSREGKTAVLYTGSGGRYAEVYHKHCTQCLATVYPCYTDYKIGDTNHRKYLKFKSIKYFSITSETYFDSDLLNEVSEDLFTCSCRFTSVVEKYNRLHKSIKLDKKRLLPAWSVFAISKRLSEVEFPVVRDKNRNLNIEEVLGFLYLKLREFVDSRWIDHLCKVCSNRCVVMDGAAKIYRTVCSAKPEKVTSRGALNEFNACINSPLPGKIFCNTHLNEKKGDTGVRLDSGVMTRARRKELGLENDFLTTDEGCRQRTNITIREGFQKRKL